MQWTPDTRTYLSDLEVVLISGVCCIMKVVKQLTPRSGTQYPYTSAVFRPYVVEDLHHLRISYILRPDTTSRPRT